MLLMRFSLVVAFVWRPQAENDRVHVFQLVACRLTVVRDSFGLARMMH